VRWSFFNTMSTFIPGFIAPRFFPSSIRQTPYFPLPEQFIEQHDQIRFFLESSFDPASKIENLVY
jgi:hypothetical protein